MGCVCSRPPPPQSLKTPLELELELDDDYAGLTLSRRRSLDVVWHDALEAFKGSKPSSKIHPHWECAREHIPQWLRVRGAEYLQDKVKIPAETRALCELKHVDLFDFGGEANDDARVDVASTRSESWLMRQWAEEKRKDSESDGGVPWTFVWHFLNPDGASIVCYFQPVVGESEGEKPPLRTAEDVVRWVERESSVENQNQGFANTLRRFFVEGDDSYKRERIKLGLQLHKASFVLRKVTPNERPVLVGKRAETRFFSGERYFEVDLICGSNKVAKYLYSSFSALSAKSEEDIALWIEGALEDELPERPLAAVRLRRISPKVLRKIII